MSGALMAGARVVGVLTFLTLLTTSVFAQNNCIDCHLTLEDEELSLPARARSDDIHAAAGISCSDCHGGDPTIPIVDGDYDPAKEPSTGFVGAPGYADVPEFCGKCHADASYMQRFNPNLSVDQLTQYWTSVHGQKLREGSRDVAQCASCHGSHGMLSPSDPRSRVYPTRVAETCAGCHADGDHMAPYGIPVDQFDLYRKSVHGLALQGGDLSAPTCNTCHGNHGATPPGLSSVSLVCGNCHAIQREFFRSSPHFEAFADIGEPECETCHGNHDVQRAEDQLLGVEVGQICGDCHFEGEEPYDVAQVMRADLEGLKSAIAAARATVEQASVAGMEVSEAELVLIDANQALVQARNAVHAVSVETLQGETESGETLAQTAREMGISALDELRHRRRGLAVSVFFILLVVAGLYFKIRQIEHGGRQGD